MIRPMPPPPEARRPRKRLIGAIVIAGALVVLAAAWSLTPLARIFDARAVLGYEGQLRSAPFAPLLVIPAFVVGGLVAAPATLMIGATVVLFGAWPGAAFAFAGMLVNGVVLYTIGRHAARATVEQWLARRPGSQLASLDRLLARRGLVAVALTRLTPLPFSLQNVMIGASHIGLVDFVAGTAIGIVPIVALMAGMATRVDAWLAHPDWIGLLTLCAAAIVVALIVWMLGRWVARSIRLR